MSGRAKTASGLSPGALGFGHPSSRMKLGAVRVGVRHRSDLGDLSDLMESMTRLGLLQPIGVDSNGWLIFGMRRLEAAKQLGWTDIPARIVDLTDPLRAEEDENRVRKNFTPSERVAIAEAIYQRDSERARANRQVTGGSVKVTEPVEAAENAAQVVGWSRPTYKRARAVEQAAASDPARYGDLMTLMDETGHVKGAYEELCLRKNGGKVAKPLGQSKRSTSTPKKRLLNIRDTLEGYAMGLEHFDTRGDDCREALTQVREQAMRIARAIRALERA